MRSFVLLSIFAVLVACVFANEENVKSEISRRVRRQLGGGIGQALVAGAEAAANVITGGQRPFGGGGLGNGFGGQGLGNGFGGQGLGNGFGGQGLGGGYGGQGLGSGYGNGFGPGYGGAQPGYGGAGPGYGGGNFQPGYGGYGR